MYQNIYYQRHKNTIHIWDDERGHLTFPYKKYAYMKDSKGKFRSIYGDKLKRVYKWVEEDEKYGRVFESDVPIETRVLVDNYGDSDEVSNGHRSVIFDIEVEVTDGFPDTSKAENRITSIALYDDVMDQYSVFILDDNGSVQGGNHDGVVIEPFRSEEELLEGFYRKYLEIQPTILTGWNIDFFDIPYLYNRTVRVLNQQVANCLSPIGEVYWTPFKNRYKIGGVSCLDYLALYKKFTYTEQSSYRLDAIGKHEVNMGKIEYDGNLNDLFKTDINKFIEYNLVDVKIVKALDDKLKFIDLVRNVSHKGHCQYEDVYHSSRFLEGAILVYLKKLELVAPNKKATKLDKSNTDKFSGAYVKDPKVGRHEWIYDLDVTSMYPSIIMSLNISPETKVGKIVGWDADDFVKGKIKTYSIEVNGKVKDRLTTDELKEKIESETLSISTNGVLYRTEKMGLIPSLLDTWFDERVEYRKLAKKYSDAGDQKQYEYFNRRQHTQKIILNSLYGVLGLPVFRFYDLDNAEATTTTGQDFIKFSEKMANYYYNKELGSTEDHCIYIDTDSLFYTSLPIIKKRYPDADLNDDEFMSQKTIEMADEIQTFLNSSYDQYAKRFLNIDKDKHRFNIKQEVVSKSGIWITKKRYGQWVIRDNGVVVDKLDVKGLDVVRSNFPPAFRKFMSEILMDILQDADKDIIDEKIISFKKQMKHLPVSDISLPTSVKRLSKFIEGKNGTSFFSRAAKGTPAHVKAAILYNDVLVHKNLDKKHELIANGEKIKWAYLKSNPLNIPAIAFKGYNDPEQVMNFIKQYIDCDKIFIGVLKNKIDMFYKALSWEEAVDKNNSIEKFF